MMRRISASISSWKISRCSMARVRASVSVMGMQASKVGMAGHAVAGRGAGAVDAGRIDVRWVTKRSPIRPVASTPRPASGAPAGRAAAVSAHLGEDDVGLRRGDLQPGQAGPSARRRARTWSWCPRALVVVSACRAAAASSRPGACAAIKPSCGCGARAMNFRGPTRAEPPAHPALLKHTDTLSKQPPDLDRRPEATTALKRRAPSRCWPGRAACARASTR